MGGCPLALKYDVTIPAEAPAADKAVFWWSWHNRVGNREVRRSIVDAADAADVPELRGREDQELGEEALDSTVCFHRQCEGPDGLPHRRGRGSSLSEHGWLRRRVRTPLACVTD